MNGAEGANEADGGAIVGANELLGGLADDVRRAIADRLVPVSLEGGDVLMSEGDAADGVYLVHAGRLRVHAVVDGEVATVGEIGRGEVVGEAALLSEAVRSATVVAVRDSEVGHLPSHAFEELIAEHPSILRPVAGQVVARMLAARTAPRSHPISTVAVVPMHDTERVRLGADGLLRALTAVVPRGTTVDPDDRPADGSDAAWVQDLESRHDLVAFRARHAEDGEAGEDDVTRRILRQADVVLLVADADQPPTRAPVEALLDAHRARMEVPVELVLVHPSDLEEVRGTRHWLQGRRVRRHHHVHVGDERDAARVARLVTDRGIGLVLSGGGARSMAEIGVARAMVELGIPIDAVGGTSAGAVVAGALARGWPVERVRAMLHDGTVARGSPIDPTVPLTSLAAGRRMTERLQEAAGDVDIEDLWLPFYCISTNLSRNRPEVHRRGPGWRAVRASSSIPGVFPPVAERGDVLVDGGLVDNLPVGEMRRAHEGITVVAVDVGVQRGMTAGDLPESTVLHGWRIVRDRLHPGRRTPQIAGVLSILARLTELGGGSRRTDSGDVLVRPDVEHFPMLDFTRFDELVEAGYREARLVLGEWWTTRDA